MKYSTYDDYMEFIAAKMILGMEPTFEVKDAYYIYKLEGTNFSITLTEEQSRRTDEMFKEYRNRN